MPRPPLKRRRSQKRSPSINHRAPNPVVDQTNREKLQKQLANKLVGQKPQDSDDSDRLVTRTRHSRNTRNNQPLYASGGVAKGDQPGVFPTKQERMQKLRSDTVEIIRRSRSKSTDDVNERSSKQRTLATAANNTKIASPVVTNQTSVPRSREHALPKSLPTPSGESSILGTLKPRRRQASILQLIDKDDSSVINPEDEEQFLPDFESTPAPNRNKVSVQEASRLSTLSTGSATRKRKLGSGGLISTAKDTGSLTLNVQADNITKSTTPVASAKRKRQPTIENDDDDVMAPPQSSSPESSPQQSKPQPASDKGLKPHPVPTTEQLQTLMPSKRRKGSRQRNVQSEFDIPISSTSTASSDQEDESIYQPRKRATTTTKAQSSKQIASNKGRRKQPPANSKEVGASTPVAKSKSKTKSTSTLPTPRTPLPFPLTRNANQANKPVGSIINKSTLTKPLGGSRARGIRNGIVTGAESDKENSASIAARLLGKHTRGVRADAEVVHLQPSIEVDTENEGEIVNVDVGDEEEEEIDIHGDITPDNDSNEESERDVEMKGKGIGKAKRVHEIGADAAAWKNQWANIDSWDLEFEEVSASTGGSSPLRVSVV